jgi:hypothetical protein
MPAPRKRRTRHRYDIKGAVIVRGGHVASLTGHREHARNLEGLRAHARKVDALRGGHGGGGGGISTPGGGGGGGAEGDLGRRLREAAEIIAGQAKSNAGGWSGRIPPSIKVSGGAGGVVISSGAPPAYPNEVAGVRHPVFGGRGTKRPKAPWVLNQHRPFLAPAAGQKGDAAAEAFAKVIDDWAKEHGYH